MEETNSYSGGMVFQNTWILLVTNLPLFTSNFCSKQKITFIAGIHNLYGSTAACRMRPR